MLWVRVKQENAIERAEPSVSHEISFDYVVANYSSDMKGFSSYFKGTHKTAEKTLSTGAVNLWAWEFTGVASISLHFLCTVRGLVVLEAS